MRSRIKRLTAEVASQIAAGEVIERPVSVVKELLENALDAHAGSICIEIENGGLSLIKVLDDGCGIYADDLPLAIEAHATSKIENLSDLYQTSTRGFRGEALASIASVAKFTLISCPMDQDHAQQLQFEAGIGEIKPCHHAKGTEIIVRDLFYNLPVRKKFLKSPNYEWQAIENLVKRFALSAPQIAIKLYHQQQLMLDLPPTHHHEEHLFRIRKIWGQRFYDHAQAFEMERSGLKISGWLTTSEEHRSQNDRIWVYLNGRMIQDRLIAQALKHAYHQGLPEGRHPQIVLYLELPLDMVDVNVHPAKHEVRFEQPRLIFDFLVSSLKPFWQPQGLLPATSSSPEYESYSNLGQKPDALNWGEHWKICNADFLLLAYQTQIYYLVDVRLWWQHHLEQVLSRKPMPWPSRTLSMPMIKSIPKVALENQPPIIEKCSLWGMDLQFWGDDRLCIRGIPAEFAQIDLSMWLRNFHQGLVADALTLNQLFDASLLSAYDLTPKQAQDLAQDLEEGLAMGQALKFAKCLDLQNCRKLFV